MKFIVIGITDHPKPFFPPEVLEVMKNGRVFSGGKRHHELVAPLLPVGAEWIDITVPLDHVFEQYRRVELVGKTDAHTAGVDGKEDGQVIVFASGDPLFFGFANTIRQRLPEAEVVVLPAFNSLQMLAHRLVMPYHDMRVVSLTGRPWQEFDRALIEGARKMGVLTDREHTPAAIAQRMQEFGYQHYTMYVGEHLGNPQQERVTTLTLKAAAQQAFGMPNCLILTTNQGHTLHDNSSSIPDESCCHRFFGIPDQEFALLHGREKMITKMPIRLMALQALELPRKHVLWDIGFCTGSVSIEARLQFPHLRIEAFEIRPECEDIIKENARRLGAPGIHVHIGDFLDSEVSTFSRPDAVFIGGHGGKLKEIMAKVLPLLADDGVMVFNSVVAPRVPVDSRRLWDEACEQLGLKQEAPLHIQLNDNHPITILKCRK